MQKSLLRSFSNGSASSALLKDVTTLLSRTVNSSKIALWTDIAQSAYDDLHTDRPLRLGVYGSKDSNSEDVVTALLQDPLWNEQQQQVLQQRWKRTRKPLLNIQYGITPTQDNSRLVIPSPRLRDFDVEVLETTDPEQVPQLLKTDFLVLIDKESTPSTQFSHPALNRVVDNSSIEPPHRFITVNSRQALQARASLLNGQVKEFQTQSQESGIDTLAISLKSAMTVDPLRQRRTTARSAFQSVLNACEEGINSAYTEIDSARKTLGVLENKLVKENIRWSTNLADSHDISPFRQIAFLRRVVDHFQWWNFWRLDDVPNVATNEIQHYCGDLEKQLVYDAGRLAVVQQTVESQTTDLLSTLPRSFQSTVLINSLDQLKSSPSHQIGPTALMSPLDHRRSTLQLQIIPQLQLRFQRALLWTAVGTLSSSCSVGWMWATGFLDGSIAGGVVALGSLAVIRWGVGRWERAKRRFLEDGARVGERLETDAEVQLERTLQQNVLVVPYRAINGLKEQIVRRTQDLEDVKAEWERLSELIDQSI